MGRSAIDATRGHDADTRVLQLRGWSRRTGLATRPDDHAQVLASMRSHGREPMSMTHGDFDYNYRQALAIGPGGIRRLPRLSFAAHFDMLMFGRRGIERPADEQSLNPYRD